MTGDRARTPSPCWKCAGLKPVITHHLRLLRRLLASLIGANGPRGSRLRPLIGPWGTQLTFVLTQSPFTTLLFRFRGDHRPPHVGLGLAGDRGGRGDGRLPAAGGGLPGLLGVQVAAAAQGAHHSPQFDPRLDPVEPLRSVDVERRVQRRGPPAQDHRGGSSAPDPGDPSLGGELTFESTVGQGGIPRQTSFGAPQGEVWLVGLARHPSRGVGVLLGSLFRLSRFLYTFVLLYLLSKLFHLVSAGEDLAVRRRVFRELI